MDDPNLIRRPLKTRQAKWASACARALARTGLRPNHISVLSIVCAAIAGGCFFAVSFFDTAANKVFFLIGAAMFIQLRLLCNLFDGMVAVEGGFRTKSGEVYNDFPDRLSDGLILVPSGYTVAAQFGVELGWFAAFLAVMTAYVRVLAGACGAKQDFCGPMAKPHRMAVMTVACLLATGEILLNQPPRIVALALLAIIVGSVITIIRRCIRLIHELESK